MTTRFVGHPFAADNLVGCYPSDAAGGVFVWDYHPADVAESGHFVVQFTANYDSPPTPARTIAESWEVYAALGE